VTPRPRLLFLCQTLPYPPDGGVWIRTYNILRLLARTFDVTALCFERMGGARSHAPVDPAASRDALARFGSVEVFPVPQNHSRVRYLSDHFRSSVLRKVYTAYLYDSRAYRRRLEELLRTNSFDLVHADSLDLAEYLPQCRDIPVVCVHHNVESALLRRRAAVERSSFRRAYLQYQAGLYEAAERRWCGRVALNIAVSEQDRALLMRIAPGSRVTTVPNGIDVDEFQPDDTPGSGLAFVGGTYWFPNLDALDFFCGQILPCLRAAGAAVPVCWIGGASQEQRDRYRERYGVEITGYVEDVRPQMRAAACHIVPLRVGGGTRLKILTSWAMGKAVVSTSLGCEGLSAVDGENILIRDDPRDFANATLALLSNDELRRQLGRNARATAERLYSWEVIGRQMTESYSRLLAAARCHSTDAHLARGAAAETFAP
jgi:glycosyltransferase involved in cell wall biosynthesis